MKVFISWSGELSQKISEELKKWLQQCIQSLEVFYSKDDIEKGEYWSTRLSEELRDTNFGIVCLTPENINSQWIYYESGAISKMIESKVATIVVGMNITDVKGPLSRFQNTKLEKEDMYKLLQSINSSISKPLDENILKTSFDAFWPGFYKEITNIVETVTDKEGAKNPKVNVPETVEEILQLVRNQNIILNSLSTIDIRDDINKLLMSSRKRNDGNVDYILNELYSFTDYIFDKITRHENIENFLEEYKMFMNHLVIDYPLWRRRFDRLFDNIRYKVEEKS